MTTIIDPLCGRLLTPVATTPKSEYQGTTYYFCCDLCKRLFDREPQKYAIEEHEKEEQTYRQSKSAG